MDVHHELDKLRKRLSALSPAPHDEVGCEGSEFAGDVVTGIADFDARPRTLYADVELLRMDFEEQPHVAAFLARHQDDKAAAKRSSDDAEGDDEDEAIRSTLAEFDRLRDRLRIPEPAKPAKWKSVVVLLVHVVYVVAYMLLLLLLFPLRLLHPLLRCCGCRNNYLPIDMISKFFSSGYLSLCGVRVFVEGECHLDTHRNTLAMFSHASNLDPHALASGPLAFKWVGKRELFLIPLFGWVIRLYGHIGIDRRNKEKAIASLDEAVRTIHRWGRSVAISPEGTRSKSGRLMEFKKGPFHVALQVGLPILPVVVLSAYECWPPGSMTPKPGEVTVRVLEPITVDPEKDDYMSLLKKTRRTMLEGTKAPVDLARRRPFASHTVRWFGRFFMPALYSTIAALYLARCGPPEFLQPLQDRMAWAQ